MLAGDLVADRFALESIAGRGGMAEVWRAQDRTTGGWAAVKVLRPSRDDDGQRELMRFARETRVLRELAHPGIVQHLADGVTDAGEPWIAMEWLEGKTLATTLLDGAMEPAAALAVAIGVADALSSAHAKSLVHRDLKPSNVMLLDGDPARVKLLDFGVVRLAVTTPVSDLTQTGMIVGTPTYMAPEQVRGEGTIDPRADVFALGCVLFKCLTGVTVFSGQDILAVLARVLFEEPRRLSSLMQVPSELDELVARMLAKDRSVRPRDASAVASALRSIGRFETRPVRQEPAGVSSLDRERRWLCVLAVGVWSLDEDAEETVRGVGTRKDTTLPFVRVVEASGARLEMLGKSARILVWDGLDGPAETAARAARVALKLSVELPGVPMGLASGRADVGGAVPVGEALERAAECLRRSTGPTVVNESIARILEPSFDISRSGPAPTLVGERARATAVRTLLGKPTVCMGREVELSTLALTLSEVLADGVATPVIVTSEAGAGKSLIRQEWVRSLRASHPEVQVWAGQGDVMSAGSTFGVAAALVADACGVGLGTPRDEARKKIGARVALRLAPAEQKRVASRLCEMYGAHWEVDVDEALKNARREPITLGDQLRAAWEDFLVAECAHSPVVLVVEDLQWADRPSVELLDRALRNFSQHRWMVLALGRPEYAETFPKLWSERGVREVRVGPLKDRTAERLVLSALGTQLGPGRVREIIERAAGNAYFLEELIRAEAEGSAGVLPESVVATVEARLLRLRPEARRVLRAASIFGARVDARGVRAVLDGASVTPTLDELTREELLACLPSGGYAFRQVTVREAAYAQLLDEDRVLGHARAVAWLVSIEEQDAAKVAEHFERGGALDEAAPWWAKAAEQALEGNDFAACIARAGRATACGAEGDALARAMIARCGGHQWRGEIGAMGEAALVAAGVVGVSADVRAEVTRVVAGAALRRGDPEPLRLCAHEALTTLRVDAPSDTAVACAAFIAVDCLFSGQTSLADDLAEALSSLPGAPAGRSAACRARTLRLDQWRADYRGDHEGHLAAVARTMAAYLEAGDARGGATERTNMGRALLCLGAHEAAIAPLRAALEESKRLGLTSTAAYAGQILGLALARSGTLTEAEEAERASAAHFAAGGDVRQEVATRILLARVLLEAHKRTEAVAEARLACALLPTGHPERRHAMVALADALLSIGDEPSNVEALALARAVRAARDMAEFAGFVWRVYLDALVANGLDEEALVARDEARAWVLGHAARIQTEAYRHTFLHEEPDNARIMGFKSRD
jgi:eukaryotic-like serine/threonine-protein kinase